MARVNNRPLSPHLTIWKWGPAMLVSILHRVTGDGLAVVGGIGLVAWLLAISGGADSYARFVGWATSPLGYLILIGLTWAFCQHLLSGLRHFVMDVGAGYELRTNRRFAIAIPIAAIAATAAIWLVILGKHL